jgi:hypothetical protein
MRSHIRQLTTAEVRGFSEAKQFYWQAQEYNPSKQITDNYKTGLKGGWYSANGLSPSNGLKRGDIVYVALEITNRHRMAYHLAVQHTLKEIQKLWDAAANKPLGSTGKTMQQAFGMTKDQLSSSAIVYRDLWPKDK